MSDRKHPRHRARATDRPASGLRRVPEVSVGQSSRRRVPGPVAPPAPVVRAGFVPSGTPAIGPAAFTPCPAPTPTPGR
ncbi:hypothetical protein [Streptomyces sp. NPDC086787]|uniref:hypothetical protein n=1 Tax=Streptomyces sp. NPDC086787 TaxID=3365759 RepID=UPI00382FBE8D